MSVAESNQEATVRLNELDWQLLEIMSDGRRYTPAYLYNDVEALDEHGDDWIRHRIAHLHDSGLLDSVGSSSMYEISDWGLAALELRDENDLAPQEFSKRVMEQAAQSSADADSDC